MREEQAKLDSLRKELPFLDDLILKWFNSNYDGLTEPQRRAIPLIHNRENVLVSSPTGTGKTLAGFLAIINELFTMARNGTLEEKIYCVYISPLKALANDINKNLKRPLDGVYALASEMGLDLQEIRVAVRSGDTPQNERQKMLRKPPHILITTPESLSLTLSAPRFREFLRTVKYVIVDEIHELSSNKRGSLLSVNLERLQELAPAHIRIGLSATQAPIETISNYLSGFDDAGNPRPCNIIEVSAEKFLDLKVLTPVADLTLTSQEVANEKMYDILAKLVSEHRTTLIFTNTRAGTERVAMRLKARGIESIEAHHSSLGKNLRMDVEDRLKRGELKCVITSTSLELGIDIGYIDLVVQIGTPKSVSKALQRTGRSGHGINDISKGRFVVFDLDDLVESASLVKAAYDKEIDRVVIPLNPLDVLSQVLIGMSLEHTWKVADAYSLVRRSFTFHTLPMEKFISVLRFLSGTVEESSIYSKIWYDEEDGVFGKKRSSRMIYFMNLGTIPEDADYQVVNEKGKHIGQLSDKFVEHLKPGDVFVLGAKAYQFLRTSRNKVLVKGGEGLRPTVPSWVGEMLPRSYDLGVLIGRFREEVSKRLQDKESLKRWLIDQYRLSESGARSIISYISAQVPYGLPTHNFLLVEGYIDKRKTFNTIYHIPLGRRVNEALSRAYAQAIANTYGVNTRITISDDGFMLSTAKEIPIDEQIRLINTSNFRDTVRRSVINTEAFKQHFRHCASRSMMVLRKYKSFDISVARQQLRSDKLLRVLEKMKDFPVIEETYREIMNDMMDVPKAEEYLRSVVERGNYRIIDYRMESTPFSYGLILAGASDIVLMEDRARMLRELQGKMLDRMSGGSELTFLINDHSQVENYFKNKVPRIHSTKDLETFARHFFTIDPLRDRFNSPYPYASFDVHGDVLKLVENDTFISVYIRGLKWVHRDNYDAARILFAAPVILNDFENIVLDACASLTFKHLLNKLKCDREALKKALTRLESSYLVRRKITGDEVVYLKNDIPRSGITRNDALRKALMTTLSSIGPLTLDELEIHLPVKREELSEELERLVDSDIVVNDYVTPVFSKQYIMKDDLDKLMSTDSGDIHQHRISRFSFRPQSTEEFFEHYGFLIEPLSLQARGLPYDPIKLNSLLSKGKILLGRFVKNKLSFISLWLADSLHSLRMDPLNKEMKLILDLIESGHSTLPELTERSGLDHGTVLKLLKVLEYHILIFHDQDDNYLVYKRPEEAIDTNLAFKILADHYGPVSLQELSRFFWFYERKVTNFGGLDTRFNGGRVYYGSLKPSVKNSFPLLAGTYDPIALYSDSFSYESGSTVYIENGKDSATLNLEVRDGLAWLSDIRFESDGSESDLVNYLRELNSSSFGAIVVENPPPDLSHVLLERGFERRENLFISGNVNTSTMTLRDVLVDVLHDGSEDDSERGIYKLLEREILGIRSFFEAYKLGITPTQLRNYFESRLIYHFSGPYSLISYGTMEAAQLFRSARSEEIDEDMQKVIRTIIDMKKASEAELAARRPLRGMRVRKILKDLFSKNIVVKDFDGKYIYVPERFRPEEAYRRLILATVDKIGYVDWPTFSSISQTKNEELFHMVVRKLVETGTLSRSIFIDFRNLVYRKPSFATSRKVTSDVYVISPKDIVYRAYEKEFKRMFSGRNMHYLVIDGNICCGFQFRLSGRAAHLLSVKGGDECPRSVRTTLLKLGYAVTSILQS